MPPASPDCAAAQLSAHLSHRHPPPSLSLSDSGPHLSSSTSCRSRAALDHTSARAAFLAALGRTPAVKPRFEVRLCAIKEALQSLLSSFLQPAAMAAFTPRPHSWPLRPLSHPSALSCPTERRLCSFLKTLVRSTAPPAILRLAFLTSPPSLVLVGAASSSYLFSSPLLSSFFDGPSPILHPGIVGHF